MTDYADFLATKLTRVPATGLRDVPELHPSLFAFQRDLVTWALRRGRAAIFCDTGLGKTRQQLEWARCVAEYTQKPTLILTPLAVAMQTVREAEALGNMRAKKCLYQGDVVECMVAVTNYDRLHHFDSSAFGAVVLDESSIIKNHTAKTLDALMNAFRDTPFRLCCTATPSPNDYTELGTHAEFLGVCTREEMLAEFFCHDGSDTSKWRLKGHARGAFWQWVSTWGALLRRPSDLGYDDAGYILPPLTVETHVIAADPEVTKQAGLLFAEPANTLTERRNARRSTKDERVRLCAEKVLSVNATWVVWCELNAEQDALEDAFGDWCVSIRGNDDTFTKETRLAQFLNGEKRILVSKPKICGAGLNMQLAHMMAFVGVSDSFERTYQAIRREWRFGQKHPVSVHFFASELEGNVIANYERKEKDATAMAEQLSLETREAVRAEIVGSSRSTNVYNAPSLVMPAWLTRREADCEDTSDG
jgi:superfamily II DNA or RNA helicase